MHIKNISILILLVVGTICAQRIDPPELVQVQMKEQSEIVKLAQDQKFLIPIIGKNIHMNIQYVPENQGQCTQIPQTIKYQSLAQSPTVFNNNDEIATMLPLIKRQIVFVADPYYNVASYSIDQHFLMKPRIPKSPLVEKIKSDQDQGLKLFKPVMVTNQNEEYIIYLTNKRSFIFHYSNLASDIKEIEIPNKPVVILKAIIIRSYLILCSGKFGILVYHIDFDTFKLTYLQTLMNADQKLGKAALDMEFHKNTQLLYVLTYHNLVKVLNFNPDENIQLEKRQVLFQYDELSLSKITYDHNDIQNDIYDPVGNINIEISQGRQQQIIMVLFYHSDKTVVAELSYDAQTKKYFFVRYYKYSVLIKQIHVISDEVMLVVGDGLIGMFPYGINPKLIDQQFNGYMALTPIDQISIVEPPFFVGINKNQIEYGGIFLDRETGVACHLSESSKLREIKITSNLTTCGEQFPFRVSKYCSYEKTFIVKTMDMTASVNVASSIWIITIIFTLLLILGLCCSFAIQKKKEREIRKMEEHFEERKRSTAVPASSDRN